MWWLWVHEFSFGCLNPNLFHFGFVTQFIADSMRNFVGIHKTVVFAYKCVYNWLGTTCFGWKHALYIFYPFLPPGLKGKSQVLHKFVTKEWAYMAVVYMSAVHSCEGGLY